MNPKPDELAKHLNKYYPGGIYKSAYEAGFCGFWIHYALIELDIENIVIHAADVPTSNKEKVHKTDKVDSKKLAKNLENNDLEGIYIPDNKKQQLRSLCRLRSRLVSHSTRIKNLLSIPGIGFYTAATLYTEIIEIERFKNLNRLAAFVGLIPGSNSSGEKEQLTGLTPRKNPHLRHLLVEASWIAVRRDPSLLKAFSELTKRMTKSQAISTQYISSRYL